MDKKVQPFFVWAGGKRRLLPQIRERYPAELINGEITGYIEPFAGGGAVFFDIMSRYNIKKSVLIDINPNLINAYICLRDYPDKLISLLSDLENKYNSCDIRDKKIMYYEARQEFNRREPYGILQASLFIFLCKAIFNGAYRVNGGGKLNTPFGCKERVKLYDYGNMRRCAELLKNTELIDGDYRECGRFLSERSFLFLDPPYRPTEKSGYLKYTANPFTDVEQIYLSDFYKKAADKGACVMMTNSCADDGFLETLYQNYNIDKLSASYMMSGNSEYRKRRFDLIITNY
jgi:DNA adenine methylase